MLRAGRRLSSRKQLPFRCGTGKGQREAGRGNMAKELLGTCNTTNKAVLAWVQETANLCRPDEVFWCNGSKGERKVLTEAAESKGILIRLNQKKLPGCYYHRSNPNDVARVEQSTFICTVDQEEAGPTNNWI